MILRIIKHQALYLLFLVQKKMDPSDPKIEKYIKLQKVSLKACYGDVEAQYTIGIQSLVGDYRNIHTTGKEIREAMVWFKKAADQGHSKSRYELAQILLSGKTGTIIDQHTAYELMKKSAYQGYDRAEYELGMMYRHGTGTRKDYIIAREWFEKAAVSGNHWAQKELVKMYKEGLGGKQNITKAEYWQRKIDMNAATAIWRHDLERIGIL